MLHVIVAGLLAMSNAGEESVDKLAKACESLASADSYSFKVTTTSEGGSFSGRGGPGSGGPEEPTTGEYQKSQPLHVKRGSNEVFRADKVAVYKSPEGKWTTFDLGDRPGGPGSWGGRRRDGGDSGGDGQPGRRGGNGEPGAGPPGRRGGDGGSGGGEGGEPGAGPPGGRGERGGQRNPEFGARMAAYSLASTPVPHKVLGDIRKKVESVTVETKDGATVYVAKLNKEAVRELSGGPSGPMPGRGGDEGGKAPEFTGSVRVKTNAAGQVESVELDTHSKFFFADREMERSRKSTIELTNVGKTQVDVPKDAQSMLKAL